MKAVRVLLQLMLLAVSVVASVAALAEAEAEVAVEIESPRAGWRAPERSNAAFTQTINYPASSVNTPLDQSDAARIRGRIGTAGKGPARLLVNGIAMPLRVESDGSFDRPYAFPSGSNSVEVRDAAGAQRRLQFYSAGVAGTQAKLRVVLSWDSDYTDLDLHVITPDGGHAWYGSQVLANGGALDVDVTTGYGPEIFASPTPLPGVYLVYVNYFGGGYGSEQDLTVASISIISQEGTPNEKQETVLVPMRTAGELTLVKRFSYP